MIDSLLLAVAVGAPVATVAVAFEVAEGSAVAAGDDSFEFGTVEELVGATTVVGTGGGAAGELVVSVPSEVADSAGWASLDSPSRSGDEQAETINSTGNRRRRAR